MKFLQRVRRRRLLIVLLLGLGAAVYFGPSIGASFLRARARAALLDRDAERALSRLRWAERLSRDDAETQVLMARAFRRHQRFDQMREHLRRARELGHPAEALRREEWLALAQSGALSRVEGYLQRLMLDPGDDGREICEAFVNGYMLAHRPGDAARLIEVWQAEYPDDPLPHVYLALQAEESGRWSDAAEAYQQALALGMNAPGLRNSYADALFKLGRIDEALAEYQRTLEEQPGDADALAGSAACLTMQRRPDEARAALERLLRSSPDHVEGLIALGRLELTAARPAEAARRLERAARLRPWDAPARYALALALQADGREDEARPHFDFVHEARQANARMTTLRERAEASPGDIEARYELGSLLARFGEPAEAADWLRSVLDLAPEHGEARAVLSKVQEGLQSSVER